MFFLLILEIVKHNSAVFEFCLASVDANPWLFKIYSLLR
jgi:hypothetical protein